MGKEGIIIHQRGLKYSIHILLLFTYIYNIIPIFEPVEGLASPLQVGGLSLHRKVSGS